MRTAIRTKPTQFGPIYHRAVEIEVHPSLHHMFPDRCKTTWGSTMSLRWRKRLALGCSPTISAIEKLIKNFTNNAKICTHLP